MYIYVHTYICVCYVEIFIIHTYNISFMMMWCIPWCDVYDGDMIVVSKRHNNTSSRCGSRRCGWCMCVCMYERDRQRERERERQREIVRDRECVVCVCVRERDRQTEREWVCVGGCVCVCAWMQSCAAAEGNNTKNNICYSNVKTPYHLLYIHIIYLYIYTYLYA